MRIGAAWAGLVGCVGLAAPAAAATPAQLAASVSQANLTAHVAALEGDRSTPAAQAAAAAYIAGQLAAQGYGVTTQPVGSSANLVAERTGMPFPEQVFVLGAHFDSVPGTPGADDDASGVAAVLEAARILAQEPLAVTVRFVFFALEESGIQGSEAYAAALAAAGVDVVGMISVEMIGYTCTTPGCQIVVPDFPGCLESTVVSNVGSFIGVGANTASVPMLQRFLAASAALVPALETATVVVAGTGTCFPDSRRSDHKSFWDEGYPALVVTDGAEARNPHYHQASDTLATLDMGFAADVTRALVGFVASVALPAPVPSLAPGAAAALALVLAVLAGGWLRRRSR